MCVSAPALGKLPAGDRLSTLRMQLGPPNGPAAPDYSRRRSTHCPTYDCRPPRVRHARSSALASPPPSSSLSFLAALDLIVHRSRLRVFTPAASSLAEGPARFFSCLPQCFPLSLVPTPFASHAEYRCSAAPAPGTATGPRDRPHRSRGPPRPRRARPHRAAGRAHTLPTHCRAARVSHSADVLAAVPTPLQLYPLRVMHALSLPSLSLLPPSRSSFVSHRCSLYIPRYDYLAQRFCFVDGVIHLFLPSFSPPACFP